MCIEQILIQFGISLFASLLAGFVVYLITEPRLKGTIKTIQNSIILPLDTLKTEIPKITEAINKLTEEKKVKQ